MAKFYPYPENKQSSYEYEYEEFIEHLRGNHEIFMSFNGIRIGIFPGDNYNLRVDDKKFEYVSKHDILKEFVVPGKTLKDIWDDVELIDVF